MRMRTASLVLTAIFFAACASGGNVKPLPGKAEKMVNRAEEKLREGLTNAAGRRYRLALSLYQKTDDRKNSADVYNRLGRLSLLRGEPDAAQRYVLSAKLIAKKEGYRQIFLDAAITEALIQTAAGNFEKAKNVLAAAAGADSGPARARVENVRGRISMAEGDYEAARARFESALDAARAAKNVSARSSATANLGVLFMKLEEYDKALAQFQKSLETDRALADTISIGATLHLIGKLYEAKGDPENALYHYDLALKANAQVDIPARAEADRKARLRLEAVTAKPVR